MIMDIKPGGKERQFCDALSAMFEEDDNYRKIHEIGFGLNPDIYSFKGDKFLPNEMRRGVHFGLGLTPFTELHLDLACDNVAVIIDSGKHNERVL